MQTRPKLHPDAPRRLKSLFRKLGSMRKVAEARGVNVRYVSEFLNTGRAPSNPAVGQKLFAEYPSYSRIKVGDGRTKEVKWWMGLHRYQQTEIIHFAYHYKEETAIYTKKG